jgi:tetrapyrrole methylase family protein/MazG family protein
VTGRVVVVGLGPAGPDLLTERARRLLASVPAEARFVRTDRHPAVVAVGPHRSFDDAYEQASRLEDVYARIVEQLVESASDRDVVLYAVPGSPLVAERTVELLRADPRVSVTVEASLSFLDLAWARLGVDPVAAGARLVDGQRFAVEAAGERGPLLVAQCDSRDVLSAIKLSVDEVPGDPVMVLQRLGLPDESVREVKWPDLDREVEPDHLTTLWIPSLALPVGAELVRFHELVATLRERCPWDREQTPSSLRRYLLEEAYEVLDALDRLAEPVEREHAEVELAAAAADVEAEDVAGRAEAAAVDDLEEELGDLLFQISFHSVIAAERGWFTLADVARGIHDKLVRRHPHVFGDVRADEPAAVVRNWDRIKREEKAAAGKPSGAFVGVPRALPALAYAAKLQRRALPLGAGWLAPDDARAAVAAGVAALGVVPGGSDGQALRERFSELGELLFALVGVARVEGIDPEEALREAAGRFRARVEEGAAEAERRGVDLAALEPDARARFWSEQKDL